MRLIFVALIGFLFSMQSFGQDWKVEDVRVYDEYDKIQPIFERGGDTIYVVNFWATWCGPCVKELPYFLALDESVTNDLPIKLILVSLDFPKHIESKLLPFLNKNEITSEVILLNDPKVNDWIDKVDPSWSGSIPITVVYKGDKRVFLEREFHSKDEIVEEIEQLLSK